MTSCVQSAIENHIRLMKCEWVRAQGPTLNIALESLDETLNEVIDQDWQFDQYLDQHSIPLELSTRLTAMSDSILKHTYFDQSSSNAAEY